MRIGQVSSPDQVQLRAVLPATRYTAVCTHVFKEANTMIASILFSINPFLVTAV